MTPVGNGTAVVIGGTTYCFETVSFSVTSTVESTALFGGGVYRAATAASGLVCTMKTRFHHDSMAAYVTLMKSLASAKTTVTVDSAAYTNLVLTNGKVISEEGSQYAVCELEFREVDN